MGHVWGGGSIATAYYAGPQMFDLTAEDDYDMFYVAWALACREVIVGDQGAGPR